MKQILLLALFSSVISCTTGQEIQRTVVATEDPHELYVGDSSSTELFYLQLKPTGPIRGVLVILPSGGESVESTLQQIELHLSAIEHGIMVIVPSINWGTFDRGPETALLDGLNRKIQADERVAAALTLIGDGLTLARKR